jgi:hypothetical protein
MPLFIGGISQAALRFALNVRILHCQPRVCLRKFGRTAELVRTAHLASRCKILLLFYRDIASLFPELRHVVAALSLIDSFSGLSQAQTVANPPSINFVNNASMPSDSLGIRPAHLWSFDYVKLLWSDAGAVLTAPANWNEVDWMYASFTAAGIGAAASLDNTIKATVQAHRTLSKSHLIGRSSRKAFLLSLRCRKSWRKNSSLNLFTTTFSIPDHQSRSRLHCSTMPRYAITQ